MVRSTAVTFSFLILCCINLLVFCVLPSEASCSNACFFPTNNQSSPPSITDSEVAVLHSKCYSMCSNQVLQQYNSSNHLNCSLIEKIELCRLGCVIHNSEKKNGSQDCIDECINHSQKSDNIPWSGVYSINTCSIQNGDKDFCNLGCLIPLENDTDNNFSIPAPNITYIFINSRKLYFVVNMSSMFKESTDDLRVAMVIQILDTNTSREYYHWMPTLQPQVDLSYFACHYLVIKVKIIYGNSTTSYSPAVNLCAEPIDQCTPTLVEDFDKDFMEKLNIKMTQLENKVTELLDLVQPPYLTTTTIAPAKRLDQIEAKLNSLMNMINHKLP